MCKFSALTILPDDHSRGRATGRHPIRIKTTGIDYPEIRPVSQASKHGASSNSHPKATATRSFGNGAPDQEPEDFGLDEMGLEVKLLI